MPGTSAGYSELVKTFSTSLIHSLVQARMGGRRLEQECCAQSNGERHWFNNQVDEIGEVTAYLRSNVPRLPPQCRSIVLEFLLFTSEGTILPIEYWVITADELETDIHCPVETDFYQQLATGLRSIMMAARVVPAFRKFVPKQSSETYVIAYRIYENEMFPNLGKDYKERELVNYVSAGGNLQVVLHYRDSDVMYTSLEQTIRDPDQFRNFWGASAPQLHCSPTSTCSTTSTPPYSRDVYQRTLSAEPIAVEPASCKFTLGESVSSSCSSSSADSVINTTAPSCKEKNADKQTSTKHVSQSQRTQSFPFSTLLSASCDSSHSEGSRSYSLFGGHSLPDVPEIQEPNTASDPEDRKVDAPDALESLGTSESSEMTDIDFSIFRGRVETVRTDLNNFIAEFRKAKTPEFSEDIDATVSVNLIKQFAEQKASYADFVCSVNKFAQE